MTLQPQRSELDGMVITRLPPGPGGQTSDFHYEWEDVSFSQRVWESELDGAGGWRVDLQVAVLRGDRLADLSALRAFMTEYHERDEDWSLDDFSHGPWTGFISGHEVFWLVEPGWAAEVRDPFDRLDRAELEAVARGVTPLEE